MSFHWIEINQCTFTKSNFKMIFTHISSFFYILLFIFIYNLCSYIWKNRTLNNALLILGNIVVLSTLTTFISLGFILLISSLVYWAGKHLSKLPTKKRWLQGVFIGILILLFVLKNYKIVGFDLLQRIGLSYILFRLIHFIIESGNKSIKDYSWMNFVNYIIFFPTFIAGPIDEYNNFNYWAKQRHNSYKTILIKAGLFRLLLGVVKKFFLVPIILNYALDFSLFQQEIWQESLFYSLILYSFYILFDFSGYSDIAIGTAYLIGIKTPENFNTPYLAPSLSNFWKRWHMTFSDFLFKYVFKPIVINLSKVFHKAPRLFVSSLGYILTFTICGIWHGTTLNFLYWGLWHGVGLIFFKLWDVYFFQKRKNQFSSKLSRRLSYFGGMIVTFSFVTAGWFFFNYNTSSVGMILSHITEKNSTEIQTSSVVAQGNLALRIDFPENSAPFVDIAYSSEKSDEEILVEKIETTPNNIYYLLPVEAEKQLLYVKIRSNDGNHIGEWKTNLLYLNRGRNNTSYLEQLFFGNPGLSKTLREFPENIIIPSLDFPSDANHPRLEGQIEFVKDYGTAIRLSFTPAPELTIEIDQKFEQEEWKNYLHDLSADRNYVHIHGFEEHAGTNRNVRPGNHQFRIRYHKGLRVSQWETISIKVEDYD